MKEIAVLERIARAANGRWLLEVHPDPAAALVKIARARKASTIAVEGARLKRRWLAPPTFGCRLLEAGAPEILLLRPFVA